MASDDVVGELERNNFEPYGGDNSTPYSESDTPPHLNWAKDLRYVLDDREGCDLFREFLTKSNAQNEFDFWFGCKGLRNVHPDDFVRIAKEFFDEYVRPRGQSSISCISSDKRLEMQRKFADPKTVDEHIFDDAQREVEENLRIRHTLFIEDEIYIKHLNQANAVGIDATVYYNCANDSANSSSSSNSGDVLRPHSSMLPTVHEELELESSAGEKMLTARCYSDASTVCVVREESSTSAASASATDKDDAPMNVVDVGGGCYVVNNNVNFNNCCNNRKYSPTRSDRKRTSSSNVSRESNSNNNQQQSGGEKQRKSPIGAAVGAASSSSSTLTSTSTITPHKLTHSTLAKTFGQRMHSAIRPVDSSQPGAPPHPYHTAKPYVPYLNTSAQDSELQSMSSDAATESSVSANFRHSERLALKYAKQNVATESFIPRPLRINDAQPQNMTSEKFRRAVFAKLEKICKEYVKNEKLNESLKMLSEPENQENSHRAAVEKFSNVEKLPEDNAESILDEHWKLIGWTDTPPPLYSPNFAMLGRRKSPGSKSPDRRGINRMMTASYPVTMPVSYLQPSAPYQQQQQQQVFQGTTNRTTPFVVDQSQPQQQSLYNNIQHWNQQNAVAMQQSFSGSPRHRGTGVSPHSPANTLNRHSKTTTSDAAPPPYIGDFLPPSSSSSSDKQRTNVSTRTKIVSRSDTSGISSSTSTQVSTDPSTTGAIVLSSGARPKSKSTETHPANSGANFGTGAKQKPTSHSSSSTHSKNKIVSKTGNNNPSSTTVDLTAANLALATQRLTIGGGKSGRKSLETPSIGVAHNNFITVIYSLPNVDIPFKTIAPGSQVTLKQFKGLLARKQGPFKYFFKEPAAEEGREFWREVFNDNDVVPFHGANVVEARVEASE